MTEMLIWKGKGQHARISPCGAFVGYENNGVVVANVASKEEIFREGKGMDPHWIGEDQLAYRHVGGSHFYVFDLANGTVEKREAAPGAVFKAGWGHWASWERKSGRLWVDGGVVREGVGELVSICDIGVVVKDRPADFKPAEHYLTFEWGNPIPTIATILEGEARPADTEVVTPEGITVTVTEKEKKLMVWVRIPDAIKEGE